MYEGKVAVYAIRNESAETMTTVQNYEKQKYPRVGFTNCEERSNP